MIEYVLVLGIIFTIVSLIAWRWVIGINFMHKNYPNYKAEDFLSWDEPETPSIDKKARKKKK